MENIWLPGGTESANASTAVSEKLECPKNKPLRKQIRMLTVSVYRFHLKLYSAVFPHRSRKPSSTVVTNVDRAVVDFRAKIGPVHFMEFLVVTIFPEFRAGNTSTMLADATFAHTRAQYTKNPRVSPGIF